MNEARLDIGVAQLSGARVAVVVDLIKKYLADHPDVAPVRMIEIGAYEGASAIAWSHVIGDAGRVGTITCIDPWEPYIHGHSGEHAARMDGDLASGDVYARFQQNRQHEHTKARIYAHVGTIDNFKGMPKSFDIVFVDGCHRYSACLNDIKKAAWLLKPGGLICGDDLEKQVEHNDEHANGHCEEEYCEGYHPGVSLAIAAYFGPPGSVFCREGVWAMRKKQGGGFTAKGVL